MDWEIRLSRRTAKFLDQRHLPDEFVIEPLVRAIRKLVGETVSVDLRKTAGKWEGYYRVRSGKVRIIFSLDFDRRLADVEVVDNRGSAYR